MDDAERPPVGGAAFANDAIDVRFLPRLADHEFESLDPAYVRLRAAITLAVGAVATAMTILVAIGSSSWRFLLVGAGVVALVAVVGVLQRVEIARMGYLVREHDLSFRRGVIARSVATVPFARVQHVAIGRGPAERWFGLATLQLRTAGGQIAIPGLSHELAERLKQRVADRAGALADAELADDGG